jgi:hypothetical protein
MMKSLRGQMSEGVARKRTRSRAHAATMPLHGWEEAHSRMAGEDSVLLPLEEQALEKTKLPQADDTHLRCSSRRGLRLPFALYVSFSH